MMSSKRSVVVGAAVICLAMLAPGNAQERTRTVGQYQCKDVMRDSGANRDVVIAFLHGFLLGKSGRDEFNLQTLHEQTDAFVERCLSNPDEKAIDAMTTVKQ